MNIINFLFRKGLYAFEPISRLRSLLMVFIIASFSFLTTNAQTVSIEATTSSQANGNSLTFVHNSGTAANRLVLVSIQLGRQSTVNGNVTYGGNNMTLVGSTSISSGSGFRNFIYIYRLVNPPTGNQNIVINTTGDLATTNGIIAGAVTFSNVDQTNPVRAYVGNSGDSATSTIASIPTGPGEIVFSAIAHSSNTTVGHGTDQVEQWQLKRGTDTDNAKGKATTKIISSGTTTSVTYSNHSGRWAAGAVSVRFNPCTPGPVNFALGATSSRCQAAGSVTYTATALNATTISYALDATSLAAGNTINVNTGQVTYVSGWFGTSTITVTASCGGNPVTGTHVVTTSQIVATPVFNLGATSQRCSGAGSVTYTATAAGATSITYSLDGASLAGGNTINASTGQVTYAPAWSGTSIITATAAGCNGPTTATHTATNSAIFVNNDSYTTPQGQPIAFNVLTNDLCSINPSSLTIVQQPVGGFIQVGSNGNIVYVSFGSFLGTDTFTYNVCSSVNPLLCGTATVTIDVTEVLDNPCTEANKPKTYYLPFPENNTQLRQSLISAASENNLTLNARSVVSISVPYPGTVIYYDHWEDGYENEITNPQQSTTLVWGDGDLTNGVAPGYPTDIIPPGGYVAIDNTFPWNRPTSTIVFDGRDKIHTTADVSVTKVTADGGLVGTIPLFDVQSVKTNVADVSRFGQFFVLPFGENVTTGPTTAFRYTGLFVRAEENGTIVQLDYDGNGTFDVTSPTLNQGEVWFYNGQGSTPGVAGDINQAIDIKAGARVSANKNVGIDLVFGGIDTYGTRNIPVFPSQFYGSTYYTPLYSTNTDAPIYVYFVNPNSSAITINWTRGAGAPTSGSFTVPANNGISFFNANVAAATRFTSAGGESYTAIGIVDADTSGSAYDWAFNLFPEARLSNFATLGWAPGSSNGTANYNPVWVTPTANTTIYVKYNGNVTTGPNQSPCGAFFDVSFNVNQLQSQLIFGLNNDNSGMSIYSCNDVPFAAIWGQRPFGTTVAGTPALDVGYTTSPKCLAELVFATDDRSQTFPNTPVIVNVAANDRAFLCTLNPLSTLLISNPSNGTVVVNPDGTVTYTPVPGFLGTDSFVYQICAQAPENNVCDTATVFIDVQPVFIEGQNTICGTVFEDANVDQIANIGEVGIGNIAVRLYEDLNKNGVLDPGEPLVQTVNSSNAVNLGYFQFNLPQNNTYLDQFNTNGVGTGNNGTLNWANNWTKIVEAGTFAQNNIQVTGNRLRIQGNGATSQIGAFRTANLTGANSAVLTYVFDKSAFSSATADWVDMQVASTATGPWTTLRRYSGTAVATGSETFNITPWISATTTIRFVESSDSNFSTSERVFFDDVQIERFTNNDYIVQLSTPIGNNWAQTTSPVFYPISFIGVNNTNCSNIFGLAKLFVDAQNDINQVPSGVTATGNVITNDSASDNTAITVQSATYLNASGTPTALPLGVATQVYDASNVLAGSMTLNANGTYTFVPVASYAGTVPVNYTAVSANGTTDTASLSIKVIPGLTSGNNNPIAQNDTASTVQGVSVTSNVLSNDSDPDGNALTVSSASIPLSTPTQLSGVDLKGNVVTNAGSMTLNADGTYTFVPTESFIGYVNPVTYTISDGNSGTDSATITVIVIPNAGNDVFANDDANSAPQGITQTGNILTNDFDPQGNTITVSSAIANGTPLTIGSATNVPGVGTVTLNANGTYTFVPLISFVGTVNIPHTICDNGVPQACDTATLYLTALTAIKAQDDINQTQIGVSVSGNLLFNDSNAANVSSASQGSTPIVIGSPTAIIGGTITINANGSYTYVPSPGFEGTVPVISYTAKNADGSVEDNATLNIEVISPFVPGQNNDPFANHDTATVQQSETVTVFPLLNDSDLDGDTISITQITGLNSAGNPFVITTTPQNVYDTNDVLAGQASIDTNGNLVFTASPSYIGNVHFAYSISDGNGGNANSTINITVAKQTGSPVVYANDDANAAPQGQTQTGNVITNDQLDGTNPVVTNATATFGVTDYPLTLGSPTNIPGVGSVTLNTNGTYTFVPVSTFADTLPIEYTICNNEGSCDKAILYLTSIKTCSFEPIIGAPDGFTTVGISTLTNKRGEWPNDLPNGFIALESKEKGFVITRTTSASIASPVEGMLIYDTTDNCFKLYNGTTWNCIVKSCN